jgi:PIN domain nuclease of toxin-antitoxin system
MMTAVEPLYVADTNALYWYLIKDKQLTQNASQIFEAAEQGETRIVISAIVIAELFYLNKKRQVFSDFAQIHHRLRTTPHFQLVDFAPEEVLDFARHPTIPEMHDRIIVGLARRLNAPILTSDRIITASGLVSIVW